MKASKNIQDGLIFKWFSNLLNGKINDEMLLLEEVAKNDNVLMSLLSKNNTIKYEIINVTNSNKTYNFDNNINTILIYFQNNNEKKSYNLQKFINHKLLFVPKKNDLYIYPERYMKKNFQDKKNILKKERYLYYIEKIDFLDLIKNKSKNELMDVLTILKKRNFIFFGYKDTLYNLLKETSFNQNEFEQNLERDVVILKEHKILTSRLAVVIYRLLNLNLSASTTKIGRYLHKQLHTRSKTYNYKLILGLERSKKITYSDLYRKNFKAYDLEINECEIAIKKEIAEGLINLKESSLDINTIAEITKLSIVEIQKLNIES